MIIFSVVFVALATPIFWTMTFDIAPPDDSDLMPPPRAPVPDEENAYVALQAAVDAMAEVNMIAPTYLALDDARWELQQLQAECTVEADFARESPPFIAALRQSISDARRVCQSNQATLRLVRTGSLRSRWQIPAEHSFTPDPRCELRYLLRLQGVLAVTQGDESAAIDVILTALRLSEIAVQNQTDFAEPLGDHASRAIAFGCLRNLLQEPGLTAEAHAKLQDELSQGLSPVDWNAVTKVHYEAESARLASLPQDPRYNCHRYNFKPNRTRERLAHLTRLYLSSVRRNDSAAALLEARNDAASTLADMARVLLTANSFGEAFVDSRPWLWERLRIHRRHAMESALILCALRRYVDTHGQLPDELNALEPRFLAKLPTNAEGNGWTLFEGSKICAPGVDPTLRSFPTVVDIPWIVQED